MANGMFPMRSRLSGLGSRVFGPALALSAMVGSAMVGAMAAPPSLAQATGLASCREPGPKEYLLLIVLQDAAAETRLRGVLPPTVKAPLCDYQKSRVARMGGFLKVEDAAAWAQYLKNVAQLQTFIAQPGGKTTATQPVATQPTQPVQPKPIQTTPTPGPTMVGYNPQLLGAGFAVLVDYGNQPIVATQLRSVLNRPVGLVSYNQRPYLLALFTADSAGAAAALQSLSASNFRSYLVDSRSVYLLTGEVKP
jgi:hypothetical protein